MLLLMKNDIMSEPM